MRKSAFLDIPVARVFQPLQEPSRYKGAYGGRGSGKSRYFGSKIIQDSIQQPGLRTVCIREVQKTLKDSAKKLIEDRLNEYGLGVDQGFKVFNEVIETPGDGIIIFRGMQDYTAESIKSLEGFNRAWVEEAQTLSATSLRLLRPTIREPGSELWFSWNPRRKTDPVDVFFRGDERPQDASVVMANWRDNPWFPDVLEQERNDDLRINPEQYEHVWEGDYVTVAEGSYFRKQLAQARLENRIGLVAADPILSYKVFCDIGGTGAKSDAFVFWVTQFVGREIRVLNYYEVVCQDVVSHINWLLENGYRPGKTHIYLPHDGTTHDRVYDVTYQSEFKRAGFDVTTIDNQGTGAATKRIEASRRIFPSVRFDSGKCQGGIEALGWYHEKIDDVRNIGLGPEHDWASHGADAFGLMAIVAEDIFSQVNRQTIDISTRHVGGGWMG